MKGAQNIGCSYLLCRLRLASIGEKFWDFSKSSLVSLWDQVMEITSQYDFPWPIPFWFSYLYIWWTSVPPPPPEILLLLIDEVSFLIHDPRLLCNRFLCKCIVHIGTTGMLTQGLWRILNNVSALDSSISDYYFLSHNHWGSRLFKHVRNVTESTQ